MKESPLQRSIREARDDVLAYLQGDPARVEVEAFLVPEDIDVKAVRKGLALSQAQFAKLFGFKLSTVQSWERRAKRRKPSRSARILLAALHSRPDAILGALVEAETKPGAGGRAAAIR